MAKAKYIQRGETIDYLNESETDAVQAGDIIDFGAGVGVAGCDIPPGKLGTLHLVGVYAMPKAAGAVEFGEPLFFDAAAGTVSTADSGTPCGFAAAAAADGDAAVRVRLCPGV